jgi:precorrin isomerase
METTTTICNTVKSSFYSNNSFNEPGDESMLGTTLLQLEPNRKRTTSSMTLLIYPSLNHQEIPQKITTKIISTTHETHLSSNTFYNNNNTTKVKNRLESILYGKKSLVDTPFIKRACQYIKNLFSYNNNTATIKKQYDRKITRQEFTIKCIAKSEFIAAGKLYYILSKVNYSSLSYTV